jgi:hypothetical protein
MNRIVTIHLPKLLQSVDRRVFGGRMGPSLARLGHYLMHEKHPLVMVRSRIPYYERRLVPSEHYSGTPGGNRLSRGTVNALDLI